MAAVLEASDLVGRIEHYPLSQSMLGILRMVPSLRYSIPSPPIPSF